MKILLFGKNGQLGWELQRALLPLGNVVALDRHEGVDLTDLAGLRQTILAIRPEVVVNAAAYTAVDKAESEPELAKRINADAPQLMAEVMHSLGGWLLHYSSDYVFAGNGEQPWTEADATGPVNQYGLSKLQGEQAIQAVGGNHLIFRTSWVYAARGNNFAKTMLRLARERDTLNVISDQIGAPTGAELLADVSAHALGTAIIQPELSGIYHVAAAGETSWCDYARFVIDQARSNGETLAVQSINPISTQAYPTPAERPRNSRLDTHKFCSQFAMHLPDWQVGVARMVNEITGASA